MHINDCMSAGLLEEFTPGELCTGGAANLLLVHNSDWASCAETCTPQVNLAAERLKLSSAQVRSPLSLHRASLIRLVSHQCARQRKPTRNERLSNTSQGMKEGEACL